MNAPNPILATHVAGPIPDRADLAFARLGALAEDEGETLAAIGRLCGRPQIGRLLAELEALHRDPGGDDAPAITAALRILAGLREALATIPPRAEITGVILPEDQALIPGLDAGIRFAGARVEDHLLAMRHLSR